MKKITIVPIIGAVMVLATVLVGCGSSKSELELAKIHAVDQAKSNALTSFQSFLEETQGMAAEHDREDMVDKLSPFGLGVEALSIKSTFIDHRLRQLFLENAGTALDRLHKTHSNIEQAKAYRAQYELCMQKANKSLSPSMEKQLALNVSRNEIEEGHAGQKAHGVTNRLLAKKSPRHHQRVGG